MRVGGPADVIAEPRDRDDLAGLLRFLTERDVPYMPLGNGTNLIVRDGGIRGVLVRLKRAFSGTSLHREGGEATVHAGAGAGLGALVDFAVDHGLGGLAFAAGIPGTVGGAVAMNAGAYGGEMKDIVTRAHLVGPDGSALELKGSSETAPGEVSLDFAYRRFAFPEGAIITGAELRLVESNQDAERATVEGNRAKRRKNHPLDLPSAGSTFKNPPGASAGRLIEEAGLKGTRIGGAVISERHANYFCNQGGASASDVVALIEMVRERVLDAMGIRLEPEVRIVGEEAS